MTYDTLWQQQLKRNSPKELYKRTGVADLNADVIVSINIC